MCPFYKTRETFTNNMYLYESYMCHDMNVLILKILKSLEEHFKLL